MGEVVMYGVLVVVSFRWLLVGHHGMLLAQQINLLLFTRLFSFMSSNCNIIIILVFTDCHSN